MTIESTSTINAVNWTGVRTLYYREVWRFLKVWNQTLLAPVITTLIWLAILTLALGGARGGGVESLPFDLFIAPGLIMMSVMQNAFANTSSSLILSKVQGVIVDLLMPPFTADEVTCSMVAGGMTRGILVGFTVGIAIAFIVPGMTIMYPLVALFYLIMASMLLALLGLFTGIWANGFDQMSAITNYIVMPLTFLSGTFYSVQILPDMWRALCYYNPFFYLIDGMRYALTGYHDGDLMTGATVLVVMNLVLWIIIRSLIAKGWRLKT